MGLRNDIEALRAMHYAAYPDMKPAAHEAIDRIGAILSPLAAMSPEQLDAMLVQVAQLHESWSQSAPYTYTDQEYERGVLVAGGYQALAEALRAVKS